MTSYQRTYVLQFNARDGSTIALSQTTDKIGLMLDFVIEKNDSAESNSASITITNPSDKTIAIFQKEGICVLKLGYADDNAIVFVGEKENVNYWMEDGTKKLELNLLDATSSYSNLVFSRNYPIGTTNLQIIADIVTHLISNVPSIEGSNAFTILDLKVYTRPQIISQNAFTVLKLFLDPIGYQYFINNGTLTIIPKNGFVKDLAVSVSSRNGLIGSPKAISENEADATGKNGVELQSILNYNFDVGRLLILNSNSFTNKSFKIKTVRHVGNSFEGEYITEIRAFEVDGI